MLSSNLWTGSWLIIAVSVCFLCSLSALILFCVCWKQRSRSNPQLYVIDENGFKRADSFSKLSTFKRFSSTNCNILKEDSLSILPKYELEEKYLKFEITDHLEASTDVFNTALLRFEKDYSDLGMDKLDKEDMMSCKSTDSKNTFYSTYPIVRSASSISKDDTFRSVCSSSSSSS